MALGEEHRVLRETVRTLAAKEIAPRAAEADRGQFPRPQLARLGEIGVLGMLSSADADLLAFAVAVEEVARACGSTAAVLVAHNAAASVLGESREAEELASGKTLAAAALGESLDAPPPPGRAALPPAIAACEAARMLIPTRDGLADLDLASSPAVPTPLLGLHGAGVGTVVIDGMPPRRPMPERFLPTVAIGFAAMGAGLAQAAVDAARGFAAERVQFGKRIQEFEAVRFKLVESQARLEAGRALLHRACEEPALAHDAKWLCTETAKEIAGVCLKVHGGAGFLKDFPVERFYRDARTICILGGSTEWHKRRAARALLGE